MAHDEHARKAAGLMFFIRARSTGSRRNASSKNMIFVILRPHFFCPWHIDNVRLSTRGRQVVMDAHHDMGEAPDAVLTAVHQVIDVRDKK